MRYKAPAEPLIHPRVMECILYIHCIYNIYVHLPVYTYVYACRFITFALNIIIQNSTSMYIHPSATIHMCTLVLTTLREPLCAFHICIQPIMVSIIGLFHILQ